MKHTQAFSNFLKDTVNLNATRIETLEVRAETIKELLEDSPLLDSHFIDAREQGSWALKTIIKPRSNKEFDADIRIYLNQIDDWEPKDYINNIYTFFRENGIYRDMVSRKTRCLTLNYAGDFHLDVIPCLQIGDCYYVLNRHKNIMEPTDGDGYTNWFKGQNQIAGSNNLVKVIRLIKYLRDIKQTFTAKSVLLTTLLAQQIRQSESCDDFKDIPTSLCTISNRLNTFLQLNMTMPTIRNPALPEEDFNRHWDQDKYDNFRDKWANYTEKMNSALSESVRDESIKKWGLIFGNDFGTLNNSRKTNIEVSSNPTSPWAENDNDIA